MKTIGGTGGRGGNNKKEEEKEGGIFENVEEGIKKFEEGR